ncbi:hypothetical protein AJ78_01903 [Emergomyces pasteurianus Ep9510]|uniref:Major facilitator superfamily (MFS) profile domain-containing protein n=1 Tax=Emergomyces pasteurianus Ep9510 TaxID=1447872 RepID=A0A1J9PNS0_9EURO|nr:hypothetical protein AJ78_01903 [Emergomyces pasteurianus Ep9510]
MADPNPIDSIMMVSAPRDAEPASSQLPPLAAASSKIAKEFQPYHGVEVSTIMAPALSTIAIELSMPAAESAMSLSIYLFASAFGPLIMGPLSEILALDVLVHIRISSCNDHHVIFLLLRVLRSPLILRKRAERFRKETGNPSFCTESQRLDGDRSSTAAFIRSITRPLRLLMFHPPSSKFHLFSAASTTASCTEYITLSTLSNLWILHYHKSVEISGFHYYACSLGELAGSQVSARLMDHFSKRPQDRGFAPESRIPLMIPGIIPE